MQEFVSQSWDLLRSTSLNLTHICMLEQNLKHPQTIHQMYDLFAVLVQAVMIIYLITTLASYQSPSKVHT